VRHAALSLGLTLSIATPSVAQLPPVRPLGPIVATAADALGSVPSVRSLSDGRVLVSDLTRRRLVILDSTLAHPEVVLSPSGAAATVFPARGGTLFPLPGDTTLVLDAAGASFVVVNAAGKVVRVESVPRASDATTLMNPNLGQAVLDSAGRLIYRVQPFPTGYSRASGNLIFPDSSPVVTVSFETRHQDTIAYVKTPPSSPSVSTVDADGTRHFITVNPPFELMDEWAALPNGAVAIIRWHDYHVDWVERGGKRSASPKTAWNWVRLTDEEKTRLIDSLKARNARADTITNRANATPGIKLAWETMTKSPSEVPDYPPPFVARATRVDPEGRIWLLERGKIATPSPGLIYDIIDREGQIVDRVQAPANAAVIGFGPGGAVYLSVSPANALLASSIPPLAMAIPGMQMMPGMPPPPPVKLAKAILTKRP
jgi:hypothetical protein